jgi:hypothetical protein
VVLYGVGGQAVVDQAEGGRADLLGEVDLDGRAPGLDAEPAVLPAVGEDEAVAPLGCTQRRAPSGAGSAVASGPTQRTRPSAVVRWAQTTSAGAAIVTS